MTIKYFVFCVLLYGSLSAMQEQQPDTQMHVPKREIPSAESIFEEITQAKKGRKVAKIAKALEAAKNPSPLEQIKQCRKLKKLMLEPEKFALFKAIIANIPQEAGQYLKACLLLEAARDENVEAAKVLLEAHAQPDYVFEETEKIWNSERMDTHFRVIKRKLILQSSRISFFRLLLKHGLNPDVKGIWDDNSSIVDYATDGPSYNKEFWPSLTNLVLYHGAHIEKRERKFENCSRKFIEEAHARRVYRMAKYLQRCFGYLEHPKVEHRLHLPTEIATMIAEFRYGPLSGEDKKLIEGYHEDDYKKARNKVKKEPYEK